MFYKARYYDPMLARFTTADTILDTDEISGMNRYMYVGGNPVKFNDPSGHKQKRGLLNSLYNITNLTTLGMGYKTITEYRKGYNNRKIQDKKLQFMGLLALSNSEISPEKLMALLILGREVGKTERNTFFGHNYTGNGNKDDYSKLNSHSSKVRSKALRNYFIGIYVLNNFILQGPKITPEEMIGFLGITTLLSPKPKSFSDKLAIGHDRDVPDSELKGGYSQHIRSDINYISGFVNGMLTGEAFRQPIDSFVVGQGGSMILSIDLFINTMKGIGKW